jgi:hypothetical protein
MDVDALQLLDPKNPAPTPTLPLSRDPLLVPHLETLELLFKTCVSKYVESFPFFDPADPENPTSKLQLTKAQIQRRQNAFNDAQMLSRMVEGMPAVK